MNRFKRQAILLQLLGEMDANESWCGETHLQKSAYFLNEGLQVPLELNFILYKHGPFSFELRDLLGEMQGNFLIDFESHLPYGPSIVISEPGRQLMQRFPNALERYGPAVKFIALQLGSSSVNELERLSTALYVRLEAPDASLESRATRVNELKPHISTELAFAAAERVDDILAAYRAVQETAVASGA